MRYLRCFTLTAADMLQRCRYVAIAITLDYRFTHTPSITPSPASPFISVVIDCRLMPRHFTPLHAISPYLSPLHYAIFCPIPRMFYFRCHAAAQRGAHYARCSLLRVLRERATLFFAAAMLIATMPMLPPPLPCLIIAALRRDFRYADAAAIDAFYYFMISA